MLRKIKCLQDIVEWGLCLGCGACLYYCEHGAVSLINIESVGIRPKFRKFACGGCSDCLSFCPGYKLDPGLSEKIGGSQNELIGPTLEIWEGHAGDPEIRFKGSSGGVLTALSLYCLERESMEAVLHTGVDPGKPWLNRTVQSRDKKDLLERTGSRYSPASPCEGLGAIEAGNGPQVFIGKPCDAAAVNAVRNRRAELDKKIGLVLTFFCAGPPSTRATLDLIKNLGADVEKVKNLRYRGKGWPGNFYVSWGDEENQNSLGYKESWGFLADHPRSFRCHLCPDGLGEIADISCGDAWHRYKDNGNPGLSLVLVRTEKGRKILHKAVDAGYVDLIQASAAEVISAQGLIQRRKEIFGRLLALKAFMIPTPSFPGFPLRQVWADTPPKVKMRTILGTIKRIVRRELWHRQAALLK
jgi:coenzyme F420 hydrogenase subunit beta